MSVSASFVRLRRGAACVLFGCFWYFVHVEFEHYTGSPKAMQRELAIA